MATNVSIPAVEDRLPTSSMLGFDRDRWRGPRLPVGQLPVGHRLRLYRPGEVAWVEAKVQNISSEGLYCISEQPFLPEQILDCELLIPGIAHPADIDDLIVDCRLRVVRTVSNGNEGYGAGCRIEEYNICRIGRWAAEAA
jgi:hypothetical protein